MVDPGREAQTLEDPGQLLGQHHAAVVAAGAADADRQVRLALPHVGRQQQREEPLQLVEERPPSRPAS